MTASRKTVARITRVERLALVEDPATTRNLAESQGGGAQLKEEEKAMDLAELRAKHPGLVDTLRKEFVAQEATSAGRKKLEADLEESQKKVVTLEAEKAASAMKGVAEKLLKESKMPASAKTDGVRKRLEEAKDEAAAKAFLTDIEETVAKVTGTPVSEERKTGGEKVELSEVSKQAQAE